MLTMNRIYSFLCIFILILFVSPCQAQIAVTCNDNANQLVNFLVNGVSFENATVSGFDCSTALFDGSASNTFIICSILRSFLSQTHCRGHQDSLEAQV